MGQGFTIAYIFSLRQSPGQRLTVRNLITNITLGRSPRVDYLAICFRGDKGSLSVPDIPPFGSIALGTKGIPVHSFRFVSMGSKSGTGGASVDKWDEAMSGLGIQILHQDEEVRNWKIGTDPKGKKLYSR